MHRVLHTFIPQAVTQQRAGLGRSGHRKGRGRGRRPAPRMHRTARNNGATAGTP